MIHQEREDELLDDPENAQVLVRGNLVEDALLERVEARNRLRPCQAFRHEVAAEIQLLVLAQDVIELPLGPQGRCKRRFVIEVVVHDIFLVFY